AEALYDHVYDVADADAGGEAGADRDDQEREEGVQARLDDEDEQDGDRDDRDRQEQPDRPIREDEFFHGRSPSGGGGLTTSGAPSRNARDPGSCAGPERSAQVPGSGARPTGRARGGREGWGPGVLRGGPGRRAELGEQLRHLGVGLVAVGDQLRGGLLVVVAEQALAVLDALAVRGDRVGEDLRGGQAVAEGVLEGHEAV